jgi:hypothetical protein
MRILLPMSVRRAGGGNSQPRSYLFQRIQFATEVNPMARIAYGLYKGGFLNAVSVGFIPLRWEDGAKSAANEQSGPAPRRRYLEQELLEVAAVAIPANPDALALGLKSGAIGKSDVEATLDLLRGLIPPPSSPNQWTDLAREFGRVMRKA